MIVAIIVIASVVLFVLAVEIFMLVRFLPIIAGLFMNITVRRVRPDVERFEGEDVTFETSDGVRLAGTLGPEPAGAEGAPLVVFCPEFSATRHSAARFAWFLREAGFRVFTFDFRGHGDSGGAPGYVPRQWITEHELRDLRAALRYLRGRPDLRGRRIALFGLSRGAVAALVVASRDGGIAGVVSDGAFSTRHTLHTYVRRWAPIFIDGALRVVLKSPDFMFASFRHLGMRLAEHRLGVRFVTIIPAMKRLRTPVYLIHGEKDSYLDVSQARMLYGLAPGRKDLWVVPGADHNEAAEVAPEEYSRRIVGFLRDVLPGRDLGAPARRASDSAAVA